MKKIMQEIETETLVVIGIFATFGLGWCMYLLLVWADSLRVAR